MQEFSMSEVAINNKKNFLKVQQPQVRLLMHEYFLSELRLRKYLKEIKINCENEKNFD